MRGRALGTLRLAPMPRPHRAPRARVAARDESGQGIVEAVVAMAVLALFVVGTVSILTLGVGVSGQERYRTQADYLAQQSEDSLHGDSLAQLESLHDVVSTVALGGTAYTITTNAQGTSAQGGASSCSAGGTTADYYVTTSTVTWPAIGSAPPIMETGIVVPPSKAASFVFDVTEGSGLGVSGANVTTQGPSPSGAVNAASTGPDGCASYLGLSSGTYALDASKAGYVTPNGATQTSADATMEQTASLVSGDTAKAAFTLAPAGTVTATAQTVGIGSSPIAGKLARFVVFNTGLALPSFRAFGTAGSFSSSVSSSATVFPFPSPYTIYAGSCTANDPHANDAGVTDPVVTVAPGQTESVALQLPALVVLLHSGSPSSPGSLVASPTIVVTDTDAGTGCDTAAHTMATTASPTSTSGDLSYPGLPYGTYTVCADDGTSKDVSASGVKDANPTSGTTVNLYESQASGGQCP